MLWNQAWHKTHLVIVFRNNKADEADIPTIDYITLNDDFTS
jgi:hypothetical protein